MFSSYSFSPVSGYFLCFLFHFPTYFSRGQKLHLTLSQDLMDETFSFLRSLQKAQTML